MVQRFLEYPYNIAAISFLNYEGVVVEADTLRKSYR